jgi:hypothetical protein
MTSAQSVTAIFQSNILPDLIIYDDAFTSGWTHWSYGDGTTIDLSSTSPVKVDTHAVLASYIAGWGAFFPAMPTGSTSVSGYHALKFWVHGGSGDDKPFRLLISGSPNTYFTAVANKWTEITITLEELDNPSSISQLEFSNNSASGVSNVSFDHIRIMPPPVFEDGFEAANTSAWNSEFP